MPPFEEGTLAQRFHFYSFFGRFTGPISPIYSFLRCFYQAHKPEPKKVTKSYVRVTFELRKVTKIGKVTNELRKSYETVTKSYEKLQSYKRLTK